MRRQVDKDQPVGDMLSGCRIGEERILGETILLVRVEAADRPLYRLLSREGADSLCSF